MLSRACRSRLRTPSGAAGLAVLILMLGQASVAGSGVPFFEGTLENEGGLVYVTVEQTVVCDFYGDVRGNDGRFVFGLFPDGRLEEPPPWVARVSDRRGDVLAPTAWALDRRVVAVDHAAAHPFEPWVGVEDRVRLHPGTHVVFYGGESGGVWEPPTMRVELVCDGPYEVDRHVSAWFDHVDIAEMEGGTGAHAVLLTGDGFVAHGLRYDLRADDHALLAYAGWGPRDVPANFEFGVEDATGRESRQFTGEAPVPPLHRYSPTGLSVTATLDGHALQSGVRLWAMSWSDI